MNWEYCPFCGGPIAAGYPVSLRTRIADAEQTTMTEHLDRLDAKTAPDVLFYDKMTVKQLRIVAKHLELKGYSKWNKATLLTNVNMVFDAQPALRNALPLFDF